MNRELPFRQQAALPSGAGIDGGSIGAKRGPEFFKGLPETELSLALPGEHVNVTGESLKGLAHVCATIGGGRIDRARRGKLSTIIIDASGKNASAVLMEDVVKGLGVKSVIQRDAGEEVVPMLNEMSTNQRLTVLAHATGSDEERKRIDYRTLRTVAGILEMPRESEGEGLDATVSRLHEGIREILGKTTSDLTVEERKLLRREFPEDMRSDEITASLRRIHLHLAGLLEEIASPTATVSPDTNGHVERYSISDDLDGEGVRRTLAYGLVSKLNTVSPDQMPGAIIVVGSDRLPVGALEEFLDLGEAYGIQTVFAGRQVIPELFGRGHDVFLRLGTKRAMGLSEASGSRLVTKENESLSMTVGGGDGTSKGTNYKKNGLRDGTNTGSSSGNTWSGTYGVNTSEQVLPKITVDATRTLPKEHALVLDEDGLPGFVYTVTGKYVTSVREGDEPPHRVLQEEFLKLSQEMVEMTATTSSRSIQTTGHETKGPWDRRGDLRRQWVKEEMGGSIHKYENRGHKREKLFRKWVIDLCIRERGYIDEDWLLYHGFSLTMKEKMSIGLGNLTRGVRNGIKDAYKEHVALTTELEALRAEQARTRRQNSQTRGTGSNEWAVGGETVRGERRQANGSSDHPPQVDELVEFETAPSVLDRAGGTSQGNGSHPEPSSNGHKEGGQSTVRRRINQALDLLNALDRKTGADKLFKY